MKLFFQILVIVMLATTSGSCDNRTSSPVTEPVTEEDDAREAPSHRQDINVAQNTEKPPIPLSLPKDGRVLLKDGSSRSGQLVGMDGQKLTIKKGSSRPSLPIDQIDHVKLEGEIWWPTSTGEFAIRGEGTAKGNPKVFIVGIDGFEWENSERGIARIEPEAVVQVDGSSKIPRAMVGVILDGNRYVVSEMQFNPEEKQIVITATAEQPEN